MIKVFIFDLEGILFPRYDKELYSEISNVLNISVDEAKDSFLEFIIAANKGEKSLLDTYKFIASDFTENMEIAQDLYQKHLEIVDRFSGSRNEIFVNMINQLQEHFRISMLSEMPQESKDIFASAGVFNYFDSIHTSLDYKLCYSNEELYLRVLEAEHIIPSEAVYISDNLSNIMMAHNVGIKPILFEHVSPLVKEIYNIIKEYALAS